MKNALTLILIAAYVLACNMKDPKKDGVIYKKGAEPGVPGKEVAYRFENDSLQQRLTIEWQGSDRFRFTLNTSNTKNACKKDISGTATNMFPGQDPEMDEDEHGKPYPLEQYTFVSSNCQVFIRVALDKSKAQVITNDCNDAGCPLSGLGIFTRE